MKKLALILSLAVLPSICLMQAQGPRGKSHRVMVPKGKTYVVLSAGKETARYSAGQVMAEGGDCAKVPCPKSFDPSITCWECHKSAVGPGQPPARQ